MEAIGSEVSPASPDKMVACMGGQENNQEPDPSTPAKPVTPDRVAEVVAAIFTDTQATPVRGAEAESSFCENDATMGAQIEKQEQNPRSPSASTDEPTSVELPVTPDKKGSAMDVSDTGAEEDKHDADSSSPAAEDGSPTAAEPTKRPKSSFFLYLESERPNFAAQLGVSGKGALVEIARHAGVVWRSLPESDRAPFVQRASELKAAHDAAVEAFLAQGGVRTRKRRCRGPAGGDESKNASAEAVGENLDAGTQTPKKMKRPRERIQQQGGIHVVEGISEANAGIEDGVRLMLKRDWRRRDEPNAVAVYDASLGCHVGSLPASVASVVAPLLDRHNAGFRIAGRLPPPPPPDSKAPPRPQLGPCDIHVALALSGPVELRDEIMDAGRRLRNCSVNTSP
jgi:hypothetical protein